MAIAKSNSVQPITTRSVSEQVTAELRRSILSGALAPGESLSLRKLAAALNVSFIPVRDALNVLESEGLVLNPPGRGATVAPLDLDEFHAIYRVSRVLEPELARRSCTLLSDETLDRLYREAEALGSRERTVDEVWADHRAFHTALLAPAASAWDLRILTMHWRATERYVRIGFSLLDPDPEEHDRRGSAHQFLVDAFRKRDPAFAARALESHLAENERLAATVLSSHPFKLK
ncbi:GntR family transcriptional regulator [Burkholderia pseudomultivorans]|uniref:GntR family transcriptional regulator n=1 Tax=Burkholderia pseudomultivorans TaxID=1207504 RepID=A0A132ESJ7_9BURK|nr:GntR family transcriptional regulator [Burkholderia pseudomultivorans]KWF58361.1 GntR family transcriptional regulator [Burkholderia pseudomultivorans]